MQILFYWIGIISFLALLMIIAYFTFSEKKERKQFRNEILIKDADRSIKDVGKSDHGPEIKKISENLSEACRILKEISFRVSELKNLNSRDSGHTLEPKAHSPISKDSWGERYPELERKRDYIPAHASEREWEARLREIWNARNVAPDNKVETIRNISPAPERIIDAKEEALRLGISRFSPLESGEITLVVIPKAFQESGVYFALPQLGITLTRGILSCGWFDWEGIEGNILSVYECAELQADLSVKRKGKIAVVRSRG